MANSWSRVEEDMGPGQTLPPLRPHCAAKRQKRPGARPLLLGFDLTHSAKVVMDVMTLSTSPSSNFGAALLHLDTTGYDSVGLIRPERHNLQTVPSISQHDPRLAERGTEHPYLLDELFLLCLLKNLSHGILPNAFSRPTMAAGS